MLFGETVAVYCENHTEYTDCEGRLRDFLCVTAGCGYSDHCAVPADSSVLSLWAISVALMYGLHVTHIMTLLLEIFLLYFLILFQKTALLQGARTVLEKLTVAQLIRESANIIHPESSVSFIRQPPISPPFWVKRIQPTISIHISLRPL
jgi:hypothetical protein